MIIVTGAAGFIGSCLVRFLNDSGHKDLVLVDDFSKTVKKPNYSNKRFVQQIERSDFLEWFKKNAGKVSFVFHIGARTDTTEFNKRVFDELNVAYSQHIWQICTKFKIGLVYASSAATYGLGENGYTDDHEIISKLKPLNPYGDSKNEFDKWVLNQSDSPPNWYGLKFFNVYGPNEYHKGRMASVIFHSFHQIKEKGYVNLFRSHHPNYKDGGQLRDFIYVKDVIQVIVFLFNTRPVSGIYNLGSGNARSFYDLAKAVFDSLQLSPDVRYIDTPLDIRDKYQYFTEANMEKLVKAGYPNKFTSLEEGVKDYVLQYLSTQSYY